jgi:hypothetical protein
VGTGRVLLALEVAANAIQEAGISTREDGGLKRRLAPSSTAGSRGQGPNLAQYAGLGVLCPLGSFTIEHAKL